MPRAAIRAVASPAHLVKLLHTSTARPAWANHCTIETATAIHGANPTSCASGQGSRRDTRYMPADSSKANPSTLFRMYGPISLIALEPFPQFALAVFPYDFLSVSKRAAPHQLRGGLQHKELLNQPRQRHLYTRPRRTADGAAGSLAFGFLYPASSQDQRESVPLSRPDI